MSTTAPAGGGVGPSSGLPPSASGSRDYRITQAPLGDIFGPPSIFVIPDYTRAFSWPLGQVQTLLEDLKLACQNGSEQFLGTLTFAHQHTPGEPPEVVDGQQRMVVIFLVISYLHSWAAATGLHDLRAVLWRCLCHDQGTGIDGAPWVTYRLNFSHQAIGKFFKDNLLNSFMPVVFVEAEGHPIVHGGSMGAIPMPNKLMWHLYQTASHVKRHLDTMLHTANGPVNAERLVVHLLSKCFVVAVLCQGKERGPAIFAHLNSTGLPLSSNDCLKAKLLAKLPKENHQSFLAKWREMEEILGTADIRKFLEYVKQLEEFMGTMPQLQDAYQYFSLKIASVDNSKPIVDGIFSHASVFIQRTKLKRLQEMSEASSGNSTHGAQLYQQFQASQAGSAMVTQGFPTPNAISAAMARQYSFAGGASHGTPVPVPGATTVHGSNAAKAALDAVSDGSEPFPSTAPARLEFLAAHNPQVVQSILAHHQAVLAHAAAMESSQHGAHAASLILGGSQHGPSSFGGSQHGANNFGGSQHGANNFGSSQHGTNNYGSSQHGANNYGASQHGGTSFSMETSQHGAAHLGSVERSQHGPVSANFPQTSQGQGLVVNTSPQTTVIHVQQQISPGHPQQKQPSSLATNTAAEDPFNWCPQTTSFEDDIFKNDP